LLHRDRDRLPRPATSKDDPLAQSHRQHLAWPVDGLTDEDQRMLRPDEIWPREIGALAVLDHPDRRRHRRAAQQRSQPQ
jgi:hypothetical protein